MEADVVARMLFQTVGFLAVLGALLMLPAGTADWPQAWAFLILMAVSSLGLGLWLAKRDPALLNERLSFVVTRDQRAWDRLFMGGVFVAFLAWFAAMGLEKRWSGFSWPGWLQVTGAVMIVGCMAVSGLTFRANSFAAPVVKLQAERGQRVISTGPYALVRHPMYAGAALWIFGLPLLLDSRLGLLLAAVILAMIAVRALGEEKFLARELPGYEAYMQKVRFRLLPGVW